MRKLIISFMILFLIPITVYAENSIELTRDSIFYINDIKNTKFNDGNVKTYNKVNKGTNIVIHNDNDIKQLYITYEISSKTGVLSTTDGNTYKLGKDGFLHEYISIDKPSKDLTLTYDDDVTISEIRVFTEGSVPADIQKWTRDISADLMIFSTHADDEQLFFAGVMPTYINQGKKVHVVYLARHDVGSYYAPNRLHEQLDGLWALGVTDYPTFGLIPDAYSESLEVAESQMNAAGFTNDDVIKFDVDQLRYYKPKVVLGHDENGEYGHGQHRLNAYTLKIAVEKSADSSYTASTYDIYSIPKFYLHLYDMNNITTLNYDVPLENYAGRTAYEVSKEGYSKHLSQQYTWFTDWLRGKNSSYTSATQITKYNPAYWGLYKTDVGPDINKNDLFENIKEDIIETDADEDMIKDYTENHRKKDLDSLYEHYKDSIIFIAGAVVIVGMSLIVVLQRCELKKAKF